MLELELGRFMAEAGIGIAEMLLLTGPKVCARHQQPSRQARRGWSCGAMDLPRAAGAQKTYSDPATCWLSSRRFQLLVAIRQMWRGKRWCMRYAAGCDRIHVFVVVAGSFRIRPHGNALTITSLVAPRARLPHHVQDELMLG